MKKITFILLVMSQINIAQTNAVEFAGYNKYEKENETLRSNPDNHDNIVLMGDSITEFWKVNSPDFFTQHNLIDRGYSGQTTSQMLLRFRQDVIELKPKKVVILAGINDIAENAGPISVAQIFSNIQSMCDLAKANKIKVVLCTLVPANRFPWREGINPVSKVAELNALITQFAQKNNIPLVDYFSSMKDNQSGLQAAYGDDGVHPNKVGYQVMEKLLMAVLK